MELGDLGNNSE